MITIYPFKDKRISLELNFIAFVASYYFSRVKSVKSIKVFFIDRTKNSYIKKRVGEKFMILLNNIS